MKLYIDTETWSETPIKWGTYRYLADCSPMIVTWAVDDATPEAWDVTTGTPCPEDLRLAAFEADEVIAHNAMFDRNALVHLPELDIERDKWRCTMVRALAHSLPGSLDKLCEILQIPQDKAKLKAGTELIRLFCMPRPKTVKIRRATRETHPTEWARFIEYAKADITAMRAIDKLLPTWNYKGEELALWQLDQRINDRGFAVDLALAEAAIAATDAEQIRLADATWASTGGEVASATQRDALLEHILAEYHVNLPDMQASTLERRIADPDLPFALRELLALRLQATTTSTAKYKALVRGVVAGRLRGTLQFDGAGRTGRWAHRGFQPGNMPRPEPGFDAEAQEDAVLALKNGVANLVYPNVMRLTANTIRGCIVAPPERKLVVADLSNIEGRMLAWLAGEEWKLQAFRDFDAGTGADLYKLAYARSFGVAPDDVTKDQRQIGKVQELALGYQGGVGAFLTFSLAYGINLEEMAEAAWPTLPAVLVHEAEGFYKWSLDQKRDTFGLSERAFVVCDVFKRAWRAGHRRVESLWPELENAAIEAVASPGKTVTCRRLKVRRDGAWLRIALPSGRSLCYPQPKVEDGKLSYMGINQYSRQWSRIRTYGGKLVENVTQACARDVLVSSMPAIERAAYAIVLSVHDELITETDDDPQWSADELAGLMSTVPVWAEGLPLAAAGFEATRYRKD